MSNATVDQHKGQSGRPRMQNGLDQKTSTMPGDEFDSSYMHTPNVNQYGMSATTDSFMPSYYGQMPFPYMGGTEWSSGSDSMPYVPGYSGDTQQHSFLPDAMFSHQPGPTPPYYNQPYNYFPPNNEFSPWAATPSTGPGGGMPDNSVAGFSQQNATANPYNGDFYSIISPAPQDYLSGTGSDMLPTTNGNLIGHSTPGGVIPSMSSTAMSSGDVTSKLPGSISSNGMKMVEQGIQSLSLGVSSIAEPAKHQVQQNVTMPISIDNSTGTSQNVIIPGTSMTVSLGQSSGNTNSGSSVPMPGSNAPKPVSWAAIASKPAKPQPKPKSKSTTQGLPPPIKHNMDIGTWDVPLPHANKGVARGNMPEQQNAPQRWSAPRQSGNGQRFGSGADDQGSNNQASLSVDNQSRAISAQLSADEIGSAVLSKLKSENDYNPKRLTLDVRNARFFVIKSYSEDDIHRSIKYNIWCSTEHGNKRLDAAFREQQGRGPVLLFYSVNGSGHFCGVAEMLTPIDYSKRAGVWAQDKWKGKFQVKWIYAKDVPNSLLRHIRLENNENKPVTNSRDTQEVPAEKGRQVLKIISTYKHQTSIFDDFLHYERRQVEEEGQRAKRNNQTRSRDYSKRAERQTSPVQDQARN